MSRFPQELQTFSCLLGQWNRLFPAVSKHKSQFTGTGLKALLIELTLFSSYICSGGDKKYYFVYQLSGSSCDEQVEVVHTSGVGGICSVILNRRSQCSVFFAFTRSNPRRWMEAREEEEVSKQETNWGKHTKTEKVPRENKRTGEMESALCTENCKLTNGALRTVTSSVLIGMRFHESLPRVPERISVLLSNSCHFRQIYYEIQRREHCFC